MPSRKKSLLDGPVTSGLASEKQGVHTAKDRVMVQQIGSLSPFQPSITKVKLNSSYVTKLWEESSGTTTMEQTMYCQLTDDE